MSSANVLPSAPPEPSPQPLYPQLQPDFQLQKINEISIALNNEVTHYRVVAKKYKRTKKFVNWSAGCSRVLSAALSSVSLGSALSVVGLPATIPLDGVGGCALLATVTLGYNFFLIDSVEHLPNLLLSCVCICVCACS